MKLYKKLQDVRVKLQEMELKKSGKNRSFKYYELSDILPVINVLCQKSGVFTKFDIHLHSEIEVAKLVIIDIEDDSDYIEFCVPTADVNLPSGQPIQNLGAKITYLRRYLLMNAFEIVENDMVDFLKRETTEVVSANDLKKIEEAKDFEELTEVCGKLKKKYKVGVIKPHYDKKKAEFEGESKKEDK